MASARDIGRGIAIVLVCAAGFSLLAGGWIRQTTVAVSWMGWAVIIAFFVAGGMFGAGFYARESSSRFGTAQMISLRERDRATWLRRGAVSSASLGLIVAAVSAFWVHGIVPHLSGEQIRRVGIVQRLITTDAGSMWCTNFVVVQFEDDFRAKICTEDGSPSKILPAARSLREGDSVIVTLKETALGVSADLAGPRPHEEE